MNPGHDRFGVATPYVHKVISKPGRRGRKRISESSLFVAVVQLGCRGVTAGPSCFQVHLRVFRCKGDRRGVDRHVDSVDPLASELMTRRNTRTAPPLSSGSLPLPHLGDCTHDGHPSGTRTPRSPTPSPPTTSVICGIRARRNRRRRGSRRRRISSAARSGPIAVDTPPMSPRSQLATSGSSPIAACSAACSDPGRAAVDPVVLQRFWCDGAHHRHRLEGARRHVELDEVDHLAVEPAAQVADDGVRHRHRHQPDGDRTVVLRSPWPVTTMSVSSRANVVYPGSSARTNATPSSKSSESTT